MGAQNEAQTALRPPISYWIEAFNTRNLDAIVGLYTDDAELFDSGMRHPQHGRAQIERWFHWRFSSMPANVYIPTGHANLGEELATVEWTLYGRGPRLLGQTLPTQLFQVHGKSRFVLRNGRICQQQGIYDHLAVLYQIMPPPTLVPTWSSTST